MKFITSISPFNIEQTKYCLSTWRKYLNTIVAVQSKEEIQLLEKEFPEVTFVETNKFGDAFHSKCPTIRSLVDQGPGVIINSDISITGHSSLFEKNIATFEEDVLRCGVRFDYKNPNSKKRQNMFGIDVFCITETLKQVLVNTEFTIGQPGWDYYFVLEADRNNLTIKTQRYPIMFLHKTHTTNWHRWKLTQAHSILERLYGEKHEVLTKKVQTLTNRRKKSASTNNS